MNCIKCEFKNESDEALQTHMLFEHLFYMPNCSTNVAYQANTDFIIMRETRLRWLKELPITREWLIRENITKDGRSYSMINNTKLRELEKSIKLHDCRIEGNILHIIRLKHVWDLHDKREYIFDNEHIRNYIARYINLVNLEQHMKKEGIMF